MKKTREQREKIDRIAKHLHPHDDPPDPTAHMGNYNFPQMLLLSALVFVPCLFLGVDEINDFKGCPICDTCNISE